MPIVDQRQNFQGKVQVFGCLFIFINKVEGSPKQSRSYKFLIFVVDCSIIDAKLIFVTSTYGTWCTQKGAHL